MSRDDNNLEEGVIPNRANPAAARPGSSPASRSACRWILAFICMYDSPERLQVHYPPRFKVLLTVVVIMAAAWVTNFFISVHPLLEENDDPPECKYALNQLKYNARVLFVYFVWFSIARASLFVPCVLARVATVQSRTHGFCRTYCVHLLIRDGPIYIFVVGSVLFWFNILRSPSCEDRSPELYSRLKMYAVCSCLLAFACIVEVYWHNKLITNTLEFYSAWVPEVSRRAPPDTLEKLETRRYEEHAFGDEEGKQYPSECAICLGSWESEDVIKVTPCGHAFHQECIGGWLQSARTCALCRKDLVVLTAEGSHRQPEILGNSPDLVKPSGTEGDFHGKLETSVLPPRKICFNVGGLLSSLEDSMARYTLVTEAGEQKTSIGFTGKATANYANGDIYEGLFENGIRHGQGTYTYLKGDVFSGTFDNNQKTGLGRIVYKKGGYYHGHFKGGKREGEGTFQYANGDIFSGYWKDGKKHGSGTYVFNKTKYEYKGEWKDGQISTGTWTLTVDGTQYQGTFQSQLPSTIVEGSYVQQVVPLDSEDDSLCLLNLYGPPAPANGQTRIAGGSQEVHQAVDEINAQAVELEEAMMQEAMYQSLVNVPVAEGHEDPDLQAAIQQSMRPQAPPEPAPTEESMRLQRLLDSLGMKRIDVGSTNLSEDGALLSNQCFYLAIARSWLASADHGSGMLVRDSALQLKREIEACVFCVRGDARELGDEAEAYTDYLSCVIQGQSPASASAIADLAIAIFASSLGGIEAYEGQGYSSLPREQQISNLALVWHRPGHFEAVVASDGGKVGINLRELIEIAQGQNVVAAVVKN
ncbi:Rsph1 [Symbiodinium necroappetens]|uniref:Rsph1 protein n=1 Tax=Symbiodinium necroappetens TaxID=1628268 RepID=A0A812LVK4_9DINO|nr:Rsph1 [Symbiodinium necroappetens]